MLSSQARWLVGVSERATPIARHWQIALANVEELVRSLIERAGEGAFDYVLHDGKGPSRFQWFFLDQTELPVAVQMWELAPGASEGMHSHSAPSPLEDVYIVAEGTGTMEVGDNSYSLNPGDAVLAPVGVDHNLHNTGHSTLKLVVVFGAPGTANWSQYDMTRVARLARGSDALTGEILDPTER